MSTERHYRVLVALTGGPNDGDTYAYETTSASAVTAVNTIARTLHQTDPQGRIDRLHVAPTQGTE